jgi:hypothetical protein
MKTLSRSLFSCLVFYLPSSILLACPFCSDNVSRSANGFSGISVGIVISIFFLLGMVGALIGGVIWLIIKEGKKSDQRHALAAQGAQER